jgi:hypothetical protein
VGKRGPMPERSDQRRRRNKPTVEPEQVEVEGVVEIPDADGAWHPTAFEWYRSLVDSGQSRFYEPSDWRAAHFCAGLMSDCLTVVPRNAQLVAQVRAMMADLLTTEGARRRAGIELERTPQQPQTSGGNVTSMTDRRKRLSDAS